MREITFQDDLQESKLNFLEEVANQYGFLGKQWDVFLNRFTQDNANKNNRVIAESMWLGEEIVNREQTFQDHLTGICKVLTKNGSPILISNRRGKPRKGESPWEQAFKWLWNTKFLEWQAQKISDFYSSSLSTAPINWHEVCHQVIAKQQENQRLRRKATERGFELNIYVPLGLVERKQQQRRSAEVPLSQVYELDKKVVTKEYQRDDFLNSIIGQSKNSKSKHIAITGEAGSGKTTLLGEIADELQKKDLGLPIYVSLSGLQGKMLKEYVLQKWLETALPFINSEEVRVTSAMEDELIKQFRQGRVWLLLDGVDEMPAASPTEVLATIEAQLVDWLASARVVLTCRLNIWDASVNNTLAGFDTYRMLEFTNLQVQKFIEQWFEVASYQETTTELSSQTQLLGEQLQAKLKEETHARLCELVRNPLRLSLLCQTFYLNKSGELPNTKAKLFSRFVYYFSEWKQKEREQKHTKVTKIQQQELNKALGKLALAGLNSAARYRLPESLASEVMGEQLFNLASELGWLNLVDREAETDETIYAFFHPTFQEYFAAKVIENWDDFLPRKHDNYNPKPVEGSVYRIFEPQWKEVILLWLGREDVSDWQRNELLKTLVEFRDGCNNFYRYQAYFLAAAGMAEFWDYSRADEVVKQLVEWSFGPPLRIEQQQGQITFHWEESVSMLLPVQASAALRETERHRAIKFLTERLHYIQKLEIYLQSIQNLGQIDTTTRNTINFLARKLLEQRTRVAYNIGKINPANQEAIDALTDAIHTLTAELPTSQETLTHLDVLKAGFCLLAAYMLLEISPSNPFATNTVNHTSQLFGVSSCSQAEIASVFPLLMNFSLTELERWQYAWNSLQIVPDRRNSYQPNHIDLEELLAKIHLQVVLSDTSETIVITGVTQQSSIAEILRTCKDKIALCLTAFMLAFRAREICAGNLDIAKALIYLLRTNEDSAVRLQVTHSLKAILTKDLFPSAIAALKDCLQDAVCQNDWDLYRHCEAVIWYCAQIMTYPHFYQAWHGERFPVQALENQFLDIHSQLQPTDKIYPFWIDVQALAGETDASAIAQEILNQIFFAAFPDTPEIPQVNNTAQLRSKIPKIKRQLQTSNLALILHQSEPYPELVSFCRRLATGNVIHIGWITDKPLEAPLRDFSPAQSNLPNALQNWINEIE